LDYAAATPLSLKAEKAMRPFLKAGIEGVFANPSSVHSEGAAAKRALDSARKQIALKLAIHSDEIIFTSGGTESNNLAIFGVLNAKLNSTQDIKKNYSKLHVITCITEHSSILSPLKIVEKNGVKISRLPIEKNGNVNLSLFEKTLTPETVLVTFSYVNGELGTIMPIRVISNIIKKYKEKLGRSANNYPYLHTDASQAGSLLSLSPHNLGVDLLSADAAKMYGPKGVGLLLCLREINMEPILLGGGQEGGLRSGTENVAAISGFAAAYLECEENREKEYERLENFKEYFISELKKNISGVFFNVLFNIEGGKNQKHQKYQKQLPSFVSVCVPGINAEYAVIQLDSRGIAASSASACQTIGGAGESYVIAALPNGEKCKGSSIRFSMGRLTTKKDIDIAVSALKEIIST